MPRRLPFPFLRLAAVSAAVFLALAPSFAQKPAVSAGRTLLLPHTIVSGQRATLAVLDSRGRLAPGAKVILSNGDHLTTDATGRALFVAPSNLGVILASLEGSSSRLPMVILSPTEAAADSIQIESASQFVSLSDRFEVFGRHFCGSADENHVTVAGASALVLASSPTSLTVWPPPDLQPGRAPVTISCAKQTSPSFAIDFVSLELQADSSPLKPGVHRTLSVLVRGSSEKVELQVRNLAPAVAEIVGGNNRKVSSSGGAENIAQFEVVGRGVGNFQISVRLISPPTHPQ